MSKFESFIEADAVLATHGNVYYRYRDNFERDRWFPGLRLFDSLEEAYEYLLNDGDGAIFFQCDGIEMPEQYMPPPLEYLRAVIESLNVVEIQIRYMDRPGKDIWILRKYGNKEDYIKKFIPETPRYKLFSSILDKLSNGQIFYTDGERQFAINALNDLNWVHTWLAVGVVTPKDFVAVASDGKNIEVGLRRKPENTDIDGKNLWYRDDKCNTFKFSENPEEIIKCFNHWLAKSTGTEQDQ